MYFSQGSFHPKFPQGIQTAKELQAKAQVEDSES
jgi:hypothetical protein